MEFTKAQIHAQRDYVKVLQYREEQAQNTLNEAYRDYENAAHNLALARTKLNSMEP